MSFTLPADISDLGIEGLLVIREQLVYFSEHAAGLLFHKIISEALAEENEKLRRAALMLSVNQMATGNAQMAAAVIERIEPLAEVGFGLIEEIDRMIVKKQKELRGDAS